jgi:hypothetical protein
MQPQCISVANDGDRCRDAVVGRSKFCLEHNGLYKPLYMKYKKQESSVAFLLNDANLDYNDDTKTLMRYYNRLKTAYELRREFRRVAVHRSAWDNGHGFHMSLILTKLLQVLRSIKNSYCAKRVERIERIERVEKNESDFPESSDKPVRADPSIDETCDDPVEIKTEDEYINDVLLEANAYNERIITIWYKKFEEIREYYKSLCSDVNITEEFIAFIVLRLLPLRIGLSLMLEDDSFYYIKTSPIRKASMIDLTYAEIIRINRMDMVEVSLTFDSVMVLHCSQLFLECKKNGFLAYRYYKPCYRHYCITYIDVNPMVFHLKLDDSSETIKYWYSATAVDDGITTPAYANYKTKFGNKYDWVLIKSFDKYWLHSDGRPIGIFALLQAEYITRGMDGIYDLKEFVCVTHKSGSYANYVKFFKNYSGFMKLDIE